MVASRSCCGIIAVTAVFTTIQAFLWLVVALFAYQLRSCSIILGKDNPAQILVLVYFYNEECAPSLLTELTNLVNLDFAPPGTKRTDAVTTYLLVSCSLRVVTSVALLLAMSVCGCRGRGVSRVAILFWFWALIVGGCLVGDVVCGICYGTDIADSQSIWNLLGLTAPSVLPEGTGEHWALSVPSIVLMVFCLRFGILWIPEAIMFVFALNAFFNDRKQEKLLQKSRSAGKALSSAPPAVASPWAAGGQPIAPGPQVLAIDEWNVQNKKRW